MWLLDSVYPIPGSKARPQGSFPGDMRSTCANTTGNPQKMEKGVPHSTVVYSNIKYGEFGSTTGGIVPAPGPYVPP